MDRNLVAFDISQPTGAFHFTIFLRRLVQHGKVLKNIFESEAFVKTAKDSDGNDHVFETRKAYVEWELLRDPESFRKWRIDRSEDLLRNTSVAKTSYE